MRTNMRHQKNYYYYIQTLVLLIVTVFIQSYNMNTPLWLDEIYSVHIGRKDFLSIIQNSLSDAHPPLFYLTIHTITNYLKFNNEIGLRFVSLFSSIFTVLILTSLTTRLANSLIGFTVGIITATLPLLVFYSQEVRSYALLVMLASLSTWITIDILDGCSQRRIPWIGWISINMFGILTGYAYLMVAFVQLLFLGYYYSRSLYWLIAAIITCCTSLIILPFLFSSIIPVASAHRNSMPLTFWFTLQVLLAGDPLRYKMSFSHVFLPTVALGIMIFTSIRGLIRRDLKVTFLITQVAAPISSFFMISPLIGIRLPLSEAKQFIVLLPAVLCLIAIGLRDIAQQKKGLILALFLSGLFVICNGIGLQSYYTYPKSPEGLTVQRLREKLHPTESVVSLHYSINYALWFYMPDTFVFYNPVKIEDTYWYRYDKSSAILDPDQTSGDMRSIEEIRSNKTFWILANKHAYRESLPPLIRECIITEQDTFSANHGAFEIIHVRCDKD